MFGRPVVGGDGLLPVCRSSPQYVVVVIRPPKCRSDESCIYTLRSHLPCIVQELVTRERLFFIVLLDKAKEAKLRKHEGALKGRFRHAPSTGIVTTVRRWTVGLFTPGLHIYPLTLEGTTPTIGPSGEIKPMESSQHSASERLLLWTKGTIFAHAADRRLPLAQ